MDLQAKESWMRDCKLFANGISEILEKEHTPGDIYNMESQQIRELYQKLDAAYHILIVNGAGGPTTCYCSSCGSAFPKVGMPCSCGGESVTAEEYYKYN